MACGTACEQVTCEEVACEEVACGTACEEDVFCEEVGLEEEDVLEKKIGFGGEKVEVSLQEEGFVVFVIEFFRGEGVGESSETH